MNKPSDTYSLSLTALTPLHIGGVKEKHLKEGIDFFNENNGVNIIRWEELLGRVTENEVEDICDALVSGNNEKLKNISRAFSKTPGTLKGNPTDIKSFIRNGFNMPYLPGSSLKGAISSIILNYLIPAGEKGRKPEYPDKFIEPKHLGNFSKSIMHFISVSDSGAFEKLKYYNTRVFGLSDYNNDRRWRGGWKHSKNGRYDKFNIEGFITCYECLDSNATINVIINIYNVLGRFIKNKGVENPLDKIGKEKDIAMTALFDIINKYTREYIAKEINYLKKYYIDETKFILRTFQDILRKIPADNTSCVLRMAAGSGFYSITGDWQYASREYRINNPIVKGEPPNVRRVYYKTRRFAYEQQGAQYNFYPMGFVMLSPANENTPAPQPRIALQPHIKRMDKLKEGDVLVAEVIGQEGVNMIVKLYAEGVEEKYKVRYASGLSPGTKIKVEIASMEGGKLEGRKKIKDLKFVSKIN